MFSECGEFYEGCLETGGSGEYDSKPDAVDSKQNIDFSHMSKVFLLFGWHWDISCTQTPSNGETLSYIFFVI